MDRRKFLAMAGGAAAGMGLPGIARAQGAAYKLSIFTKHLQFIKDYDEVAKTAAGLGFEALDWTVRDGGHVLPKNVEKDLPRAVEAARKAGLAVQMITTAIKDASHPASEPIVKTAAALGIKVYRISGWSYDAKKPVTETLAEVRKQLEGIAELNKKYGICAAFQNHSGAEPVGSPLWDLWEMMKEIAPEAMGVNFDFGHATVEGGMNWPTTYRLLASRVKAITFKDFIWQKDAKKGWRAEWGPMGEGMLRIGDAVALMRENGFAGPVTIHFEYEPKESSKESHEALLAAMKRDAATLKKFLS